MQNHDTSADRKIVPLDVQAAEKLYHKMVEEVRDYAILLLDTAGNIVTWNTGAEIIKGYNAAEITGKNFSVFYTAADRDNHIPEKMLEEALLQGRATREGWRLKKDGTKFWGSVVITALHDDENNVIGFSKLTRDLTERKKTEEQQERYTAELQHHNEMLRNSEERYHRMIAEVEDYAIILLDAEGNILNWNKGAQKIKGYSEQEIIGKNFRNFYREEDRNNQLPEKLLAEAIANNKAAHEGWRVRKDGSHFWGSVIITALHNHDGSISGFSKVTRDLTQKKNFEEHILQQNKQLEEYAYVASHDLQEPMRKIMLFSGMLKDSLDNKEEAISYLDKINSAASRMTRLIKAVLEYSQANEGTGLKIAVDLNVTVKDIENDFEVLLREKNGVINCGQLPVINAVPIQMHQLLGNLISNAIKFNHKAPVITITATSEKGKDQKTAFTRIKVSDNGIGFNPEYSEKIFRMFHRLHDNSQGTGIGLALCKRIVENHGGTITVSTSPNGTVFEIMLPVK